MAPRTIARSLASSSSTPMPARGPPPVAQAVANSPPQLLELRRQWKWAAVCQFFYTFGTLIALEDVTVTDIEEDLLNSSMIVLPRLMQRLLITLTQDRKTNLDNWQTTLRRQYNKRDPQANPIGPDPTTFIQKSRATTVDSEAVMDEDDGNGEAATKGDETLNGDDHVAEQESASQENVESQNSKAEGTVEETSKDNATKVEETEAAVANDVDNEKEDVQVESKDWADLDMLEKLESIHTVMEWHFQNPLRLRGIMRSDDDGASWRTEPIGYDAKHNAYWLIGTDRLWLQRPVPSPPKKKKPKKKKPVQVKKSKVKLRVSPSKTKVVSLPEKGSGRSSRNQKSARTSQRKAKEEPAVTSSPQGSGRARAAKTQANVMLDLQAKQFLAVKAEMRSLSRNKGHKEIHSPTNSPTKHTTGTRISRRLRGTEVEDDEWQQIPEEWLEEPGSSRQHADDGKRKTRQSPRKRRREDDSDEDFVAPKVIVTGTGLESGDESELTELSDVESVAGDAEASDDVKEEERMDVDDDLEEDEEKLPEVWPLPDFVEWETICVSLDEWEAIAKTFEGSKHYLEKALYKVLTREIVPFVTEGLREAAILRAKEEAMMQRKRSSRLAVRETEKEAARLAAQQKAEEDEKMARTRRQEARTRREEEERLAREKAREQRRLEREERELQRAKRQEWNADKSEEMQVDMEQPVAEPEPSKLPPTNGHANPPAKAPRRKSATKKDTKGKSSAEDWELDCEICGQRGRNKDGGLPLMSCGSCSKWQHISCHDEDDKRNHRPPRDWDKVDFTCRNCLSRKKPRTSIGKRPPTNTVTLHSVPQPQASASVPQMNYGPPINSYPPSKHIGYPTDIARPPAVPNAHQHYPVANNAHHPSLGHMQAPYNSNASMTFSHYQPHQRGFAPQPTTLQPQPQLNHQPYYGQVQPSHHYQHPPVNNNFHPSLQNGTAYSNFPGPLQVPASVQPSDRSTQSSGAPLPTPYRNHYAPIASGSTPYYQTPLQ